MNAEKKQDVKEEVKETPKSAYNRKKTFIIVACVFLVIALLWLIYWLIWGQFERSTDDAYVNGNMVQLMPQINGTVVQISTDDTQLVTEGQTLIELDKTEYAAVLQRAKADLAQSVRQVRQYFENAAQTKQNVILGKANLVKAKLDVERRSSLVGNRAVSREEMQHYKTALDAAQANYELALHQADAAFALVDNVHLYSHPLVEAAKANLKMAYLNYQRTTIVAPITGYVAKRSVQPGQQVSVSTPMLAIVPLNDTWVDANYKESELRDIRINQPVTLYADAYSKVTYHGKVIGLNAGTGSAFSLLPAQNATGNWIKIVQRLPVRVAIDPDELKNNPLQLGLSMRVTIDIHDLNGERVAKNKGPVIQFKTTAYEKQLANVETLINNILKANSTDLFLAGTHRND